MKALEWIGQLVVFLLLYKAAHILWWNARKQFFVHPIFVEMLIAVVLVAFIWIPFSTWWMTILVAVIVGVLKGDWEARQSERIGLK